MSPAFRPPSRALSRPRVANAQTIRTSSRLGASLKVTLYVRSHYDTIGVFIPDGPLPDEIVLVFAAANRGRLNARVGGLQHDSIVGENGLV